MKAIIITDNDCQALLDRLKIESMNKFTGYASASVSDKITEKETQILLNDIHRKFHYVVTRWLQDQGWK